MIPIALTIAGSDSGGGAGIQADLKSFSALGVYGASVITALTAQNTVGVQGVNDVPAEFVAEQMKSVFSDLEIAAVKIGMLSVPATIEAVAKGLQTHAARNIVLDPVMVAASGDPLLAPEAVETLMTKLMPVADLVTPNLHEAAAMTGRPVAANEDEMQQSADAILKAGAKAVLIKGGHGAGETAVDFLVSKNGVQRFEAARIETTNSHGTGCTLSSAIAAGLAKGLALDAAVAEAKDYITQAIAASDQLTVGRGQGPVHHFHSLWRNEGA